MEWVVVIYEWLGKCFQLPSESAIDHWQLLSLSLPLVRDRAKQQVLPRRASNYFSKSAKLNSRTNLHFLLKRQFL